ncbi:hypothetical protein [Microbacterium paludicola]|uniref:hypothetical protein n=1 Tax=Microbacterium paludicola TaxID=300019 RepID=UPI0009034603|nr:hypothetical protein [Microbacterium paludicola]APF34914.1 hypothetical protein BO218_12555 [Microbacterium paludicola]
MAGLSDDVLQSIGRIAVWASWVELHLDDLASELIDPRYEVGRALTRGKTAGALIEQIRAVLDTSAWRETEAAELLVPLLGRARAALAERNSIFHGIVYTGLTIEGARLELVISSRRNRSGRLRPACDLEAISRELHAVGNALFEAGFSIRRSRKL